MFVLQSTQQTQTSAAQLPQTNEAPQTAIIPQTRDLQFQTRVEEELVGNQLSQAQSVGYGVTINQKRAGRLPFNTKDVTSPTKSQLTI